MGFIAAVVMLTNLALLVYAIVLATRFVEAVERIANRQAYGAERAMLERLVSAAEAIAAKSRNE